MLRPQETQTRERKSLNGLWSFALDPGARAATRAGGGGRCPEAREMPVPASFNDIARRRPA